MVATPPFFGGLRRLVIALVRRSPFQTPPPCPIFEHPPALPWGVLVSTPRLGLCELSAWRIFVTPSTVKATSPQKTQPCVQRLDLPA